MHSTLCTACSRQNCVCDAQVPLKTSAHPTWKHVRCHDWKGDAIDEGDAVANWLTAFLKQNVRLVKYGGGLSDMSCRPDSYLHTLTMPFSRCQCMCNCLHHPQQVKSQGLYTNGVRLVTRQALGRCPTWQHGHVIVQTHACQTPLAN